MIEKIKIGGKTIDLKIRKSKRAKNMSMSINMDGEVRLTIPRFMPMFLARPMIYKRSDWLLKHLNKIKKNTDSKNYSVKDYKNNKEKARQLVNQKLLELNEYYNYEYGRVYIRNQKTRWGSCSNKKNLNFNYKITKLSEKYVNYIIVHELCHLKEMNHSKKFWGLVAETIPDYKETKKELRNIRI